MHKRIVSIILGMIISFSLVNSPVISVCSAQANTVVSVANEQKTDALSLLGNDVMFMTSNDKFFAKGKKHNYYDFGSASYLSEGSIMVDIEVLEYALDIIISPDSIVLINDKELQTKQKNGVYYLSASEVANALSMYVYTQDNRGFALLSRENRGYTNSSYSNDNQEPIDVIWRYMQFDRPDVEELLNAINNPAVYKKHPRLWVKENEIQSVIERINNDKTLEAKKKLLFFSVINTFQNHLLFLHLME